MYLSSDKTIEGSGGFSILKWRPMGRQRSEVVKRDVIISSIKPLGNMMGHL